MNQEEIKGLIPHRPPMLLVDEAERTGENEAVGRYTIKGDEFFLQGHFPGDPVVPGVMLCEMIAQASCVLVAEKLHGRIALFTSMDGIRFRHSVYPGDTVESRLTMTREKDPFYFIKAEAWVGDALCVEGKFSVTLVHRKG